MKKNTAQAITNSGFQDWKPSNLTCQKGKTFFITGGNSGIGLEAAKMLYKAGGDIIIGCRNIEKAKLATKEISGLEGGKIDYIVIDLVDLSSIRKAAQELQQRCEKLDVLINNAGIMKCPKMTTEDGFEWQLASNHLGHFLLSGLLFDLVSKASGRIVTVSSFFHKKGQIHFNDLMFNHDYDRGTAYAQSKLANLMFALELDRKLKAANCPVSSISCHPGYAETNLQSTGPTGLLKQFYRLTTRFIAQSAYHGAIPTVLAAAGKEALPGAYYGPQGFGEMKGPVRDALIAEQALDEGVAKQLWQESERLVDFKWPDFTD